MTHPYIFTPWEFVAIIEEAAQLPSIYGMRGLTCSTLFGLIAVTGMLINEALSLDADDVDLDTGIVHIRCGKLGKERLLPVHETAVDQLRAYVAQRDRLLGRASVQIGRASCRERVCQYV